MTHATSSPSTSALSLRELRLEVLIPIATFLSYQIVAVAYTFFAAVAVLTVASWLPVGWFQPLSVLATFLFPLFLLLSFVVLWVRRQRPAAVGLALGWLINLLISAITAIWYTANVTSSAVVFLLVGGLAGYPMWLIAGMLYALAQAIII